jgi:hypothetical protein
LGGLSAIMHVLVLEASMSCFELREGEQILADVGANLFRGIEGVGGRLLVTNRRLLFRAHAINLQTMPAEIPIDQIAEVSPQNSLGIIPNGMVVTLDSGVQYKFVVWGRDRLMQLIREHMVRK